MDKTAIATVEKIDQFSDCVCVHFSTKRYGKNRVRMTRNDTLTLGIKHPGSRFRVVLASPDAIHPNQWVIDAMPY